MKFLGLSIAAIEWYDSAVCAAMMNVLSVVFFPKLDLTLRFLLYLSTFVVSYLGRPLGALIFGYYSDKKCRFKAAYLAFCLMISSSLCISFLPSHQSIGYLSSILFVCFRFLQGIAIGGNYTISILSVEQAHKTEKYFASSIICCGFMFGFLFGNLVITLLNYFCNYEFLVNFGWRIPFWIGFLAACLILLNFKKNKSKIQNKEKKITNFANNTTCLTLINIKIIIRGFCLFLIDMVPFYMFFIFIPNYKTLFLQQNASTIWIQTSLSFIVMLACTTHFGKLADAYGATSILKKTCLALILISFFAPWENWMWAIIFGLIMSACYGSLYGLTALSFPKNIRACVSGLTLNIASIITGSLTPIIATVIASYNIHFISILLIIAAILALIALKYTKEPQ